MRNKGSGLLFSRPLTSDLCFFIFSFLLFVFHSAFDVGRSMFDVHFLPCFLASYSASSAVLINLSTLLSQSYSTMPALMSMFPIFFSLTDPRMRLPAPPRACPVAPGRGAEIGRKQVIQHFLFFLPAGF